LLLLEAIPVTPSPPYLFPPNSSCAGSPSVVCHPFSQPQFPYSGCTWGTSTYVYTPRLYQFLMAPFLSSFGVDFSCVFLGSGHKIPRLPSVFQRLFSSFPPLRYSSFFFPFFYPRYNHIRLRCSCPTFLSFFPGHPFFLPVLTLTPFLCHLFF